MLLNVQVYLNIKQWSNLNLVDLTAEGGKISEYCSFHLQHRLKILLVTEIELDINQEII